MENTESETIIGAEHFDSLNEYINYRLHMKRTMMGLANRKNCKDFIIPKLNFKNATTNAVNLNDKMNNLSVSPDIKDAKKNYRIVPYKIKTNKPADLYNEFPAVIQPSKMHTPTVFAEPEKPANTNVTVNKDELAFISDKTHSESKRILQGLQELYAHVKELRNDPHQMMTIPESSDVSLDLYTYFNLIDNKKTVECSTMGRVLNSSLKTRKGTIKVDTKYYDPYGKITMFDFSTPCPY